MRLLTAVSAVCIASGTVSSAIVAQAGTSIDRLAWLAGCWESSSGSTTVEEHWTTPRAGTMLGVGRTVRLGKLVGHEFLMLELRDTTLTYVAHPSGQATAAFSARAVSDSQAVFANPTHDFPQRIGYHRLGADSLIAWFEGSIGGETQRREFRFVHIPCPGL